MAPFDGSLTTSYQFVIVSSILYQLRLLDRLGVICTLPNSTEQEPSFADLLLENLFFFVAVFTHPTLV